MKVVDYYQYGSPSVLEIKEIEKPIPKENEILIKIHVTTVTATEAMFRQGKPLMTRLFTGLSKPKITRLGEEISGIIMDIGSNVNKFKIGDKVFGSVGTDFGAYAEYICLSEDSVIIKKAENQSYEEAVACIDGPLTALPFLRDSAEIQSGQKLLIYGASGSVGSAAVQLAKYYGAVVTAVCSTNNIDWVQALGADSVIDYTKEDFRSKNEKYDIIFDSVGKLSFSKSKKSLNDNGVFLESAVNLSILPQVIWTSFFGSKKVKISATGMRPENEKLKDLEWIKELIEKGRFKAVLDKTYPLEDIKEAHEYVDLGHKKGNVVIKIA